MPQWIIPFIVVDLIVTALVVRFLLRARLKVKGALAASGVDVGDLLRFTKEEHRRIGDHLRANWSGAPEQLPQVLSTLLAVLERDAQSRGITVNRDLLKVAVATSVRQHRLTRGNQLDEAMKRVA